MRKAGTQSHGPTVNFSLNYGSRVAGAGSGFERSGIMVKRIALIGLALGVLLLGSLPAFAATAAPSHSVHTNGPVWYWDD